MGEVCGSEYAEIGESGVTILTVYAVGQSGAIVESVDGHTWTTASSPVNSTLFGVGRRTGLVVAVGSEASSCPRWGCVGTRQCAPIRILSPSSATDQVNPGSRRRRRAVERHGVSWVQIPLSTARKISAASAAPRRTGCCRWSGTGSKRTKLAHGAPGGLLYSVHAPPDGPAIAVGAGGSPSRGATGLARASDWSAPRFTGIAGPQPTVASSRGQRR